VSLLRSASGSAGQAGTRDKARSAGRSQAGEWLRYDFNSGKLFKKGLVLNVLFVLLKKKKRN
jgi:hypothetical protein